MSKAGGIGRGLGRLLLALGLALGLLALGGNGEVARGAGLLTWAVQGWDAKSISDDGSVLFFWEALGGQGGLWRRGAGAQPLGGLAGHRTFMYGAAADGRLAVGAAIPDDAPYNTRPALWREGQGWTLLGYPAGANAAYPMAASVDGRLLAGIAGAVEGSRILWANPALWTEGGAVALPVPPDAPGCREGQFRAVSPAGDAAAGFLGPSGCGSLMAIVWTAGGGLRMLGTLPGYAGSEATAVSDGGGVVVGILRNPRPGGSWDTAAFRWTPIGGLERLADFGRGSTATSISADGRIIGGSVQTPEGATRAVVWRDGVLHNLQEELAPELGFADALVEVTAVSRNGLFVAGRGGRGLERFVFVARLPEPPSPPQLVAIWPIEGEREEAMITWQPPQGAMRYRLQSALDPSFSFGVNVIEFPAGPYNLLVVGAPTWDGGVFYYRLAACNDQGCSPWSPLLALGRRIWPGPEHWNLMAGGFSFLGTTYLWAVNSSPVPGKASDLLLYDGLQGFGGILTHRCQGVQTGASCRASFPGGALASASQAFPPYGEVGVGFWTR